MVAGRHTEVSVSPIPTARLWKASTDAQSLIPKLLPHVVTSIQHIEGNAGVGSVKKINFAQGMKDLSYVKNRVDVLDHENHVYKYTFLEGGMMGKKLKSSTFEFKMEPTREGGTKTTMNWDYDTLGDSPLSNEDIKQLVEGLMLLPKAVEGHLVANPAVYV